MKSEYKIYSIYGKTESTKEMYWCKSIYQKWGEENTPFKRRAKREFKKYKEKYETETRKYYLIEE